MLDFSSVRLRFVGNSPILQTWVEDLDGEPSWRISFPAGTSMLPIGRDSRRGTSVRN